MPAQRSDPLAVSIASFAAVRGGLTVVVVGYTDDIVVMAFRKCNKTWLETRASVYRSSTQKKKNPSTGLPIWNWAYFGQ